MKHLAYCRRASSTAKILASVLIGIPFLGGLACTAGVKASGGGKGGSVGATGAAGTTGKAGTTGSGQAGVTGSDVGIAGTTGTVNPDAASCQTVQYMFSPTIPTVFILVDRSGSEFDSATTGTFFTLRPAVEQVVSQLQAKVRFGFGAFVGNGGNPNCTIDYAETVVPIALNNASAISREYDSLGPLMPYGSKANTPMTDVIPMVKATLVADQAAASGSKYMLVVTDSETDFCDDGAALCPSDAVIYAVQSLQASGIGTLVIGLPVDSTSGTSDNIATTVLQDIANAGAGQPVIVPQPNVGQTLKPSDIYDQCASAGYNPSTTTWMSAYTAAGHTMADHTSIATYSGTAGTATVFTPSGVGTQALVDQISAALNSIPRSCTFDLPSNITVNPKKLDEAVIYLVDGASSHDVIPLDTNSANGWNLTGPSEVQLFGPWCDKLRDQGTTDIQFGFPCDIIICIDSCITN